MPNHIRNYLYKNVLSLLIFLNLIISIAYADSKSSKKQESAEIQQTKSSARRLLRKHGIGIGLGQTFLLGNFEDYGDNKITGDILYTYTASYSFDFLANLHFSEHQYKDKKVNLQGISFNIKGRSYEFDNFSPFVLGGLGFYRPIITKGDMESEAKNTFGFSLGGGADLRLNKNVVVGLMGIFHNPFDIKQDDMQDVRGSYFKLLLTSMYLF